MSRKLRRVYAVDCGHGTSIVVLTSYPAGFLLDGTATAVELPMKLQCFTCGRDLTFQPTATGQLGDPVWAEPR